MEQEQIFSLEPSPQKIFKTNAITAGVFLGGPLAAGYFIAHNFKAFNEFEKASKTWIITIFATILIFGVAMLIPYEAKFPDQLIPLVYTAIAYFIIQKFQGSQIEAHMQNGGSFFGWKRVVVVGLAGLLITVATIVGYLFLTDSTINAKLDTRHYGELRHEITYDKNKMTESEADMLADVMVQAGFFNEATTKYLYVEKTGNTFTLSIPVIEGVQDNPEFLDQFSTLQDYIQNALPESRIALHLVVDRLDNIVKKIE
jgi:hypothetical protein